MLIVSKMLKVAICFVVGRRKKKKKKKKRK